MVGLAKALRADGCLASGDDGSDLLSDLANVSVKDAETTMHQLLLKHRLSLSIPLRGIEGRKELDGFPRLKPMDILSYMSEAGHINKLMGGRSHASCCKELREFWHRFRNLHGDFELFKPQHAWIPLEDCIPIVCHIDGGRGYKKSEFMIFSWGPMLGAGSGNKSLKDPAIRSFTRKNQKLQTALLGHTYTTHYLFAAMPSSWHKSNETAFQNILSTFAEDLRELFDEGISHQGRVLRLVLIGLKGDLNMQARVGCLKRWYSTARKRPLSSRTQISGQCCWLCPAGDLAAPFEEIHTENPAWLQQMQNFTEPPWNEPGGMLAPSLAYLAQPAKFYLPDLFHIYLAGVGQDFCASCLVYMLPICFQGRTGNGVDKQLETLNQAFTLWRKMYKVPMHLTSFNRDKLTFPDATKVYPTGTWSKAADTARITQFILYTCSLFPELCTRDADKIMYYIQEAAKSIGAFMKALYKANLWIESLLS